jgi:predicted acetyltransferase
MTNHKNGFPIYSKEFLEYDRKMKDKYVEQNLRLKQTFEKLMNTTNQNEEQTNPPATNPDFTEDCVEGEQVKM